MFEERNFSPNTVKVYKTALRDPIHFAYDIGLHDDVFHKVVRSFSLRKPAPPPGSLSWPLKKILSHLALVDPRQYPIRDLLDKSMYLIPLASGGRISEIFALCCGPDFTYVTTSGHLIVDLVQISWQRTRIPP